MRELTVEQILEMWDATGRDGYTDLITRLADLRDALQDEVTPQSAREGELVSLARTRIEQARMLLLDAKRLREERS